MSGKVLIISLGRDRLIAQIVRSWRTMWRSVSADVLSSLIKNVRNNLNMYPWGNGDCGGGTIWTHKCNWYYCRVETQLQQVIGAAEAPPGPQRQSTV